MQEEIILGYYHGENIRLVRIDDKLRLYWGNFERNPDWLEDLTVSAIGPVPGSKTCLLWGMTRAELCRIVYFLVHSEAALNDAESLLILDSDEASEDDKAVITAIVSRVADKSWSRIKGILEDQDVAFAKQNATDYRTALQARLLLRRTELVTELASINKQLEDEELCKY